MRKILRLTLMLVCGALMLWSGWNILQELREYREGDAAYESLRQYINVVSDSPSHLPPAGTNKQDSQPPAEADAGAEEDPTRWPEVDFDALRKINPDVVGWLYCEDTVINYPIAKSHNNSDYLYRRFDGEYHKSGCLFVDCNNKSDFTDPNTVIYGHHMKNGSMFGTLTDYKKQDYYENHPELLLLTEGNRYHLKVFAGYVSPASGDAWKLSFRDSAERAAWIQQAIDSSSFDSGIVPVAGDKIVTLSTCSYEYNNARYVLLCILEQA